MLFHATADALRERLDAIQGQICGSGASGGGRAFLYIGMQLGDDKHPERVGT
jgi:hypothetical protein